MAATFDKNYGHNVLCFALQSYLFNRQVGEVNLRSGEIYGILYSELMTYCFLYR